MAPAFDGVGPTSRRGQTIVRDRLSTHPRLPGRTFLTATAFARRREEEPVVLHRARVRASDARHRPGSTSRRAWTMNLSGAACEQHATHEDRA